MAPGLWRSGELKPAPPNRVDGNGNSKHGKTCRIGVLAELKGNKLIIGTYQVEIDISDNGFKLKDAGACAQCEAGAYVSGTYQKQ